MDRETEKAKKDDEEKAKQVPKHDPMTRFYEEDLDEDSYDKAMIEELFDKKKFKFNRHSYRDNFGVHFMNAGSPLKGEDQTEQSDQEVTEISDRRESGNANEQNFEVTSTDENLLDNLDTGGQGANGDDEDEETDDWADSPPVYNLKRRGGFLDGEDASAALILPKIGNGKGQIKLSSHLTSLQNMTGAKRPSTGGGSSHLEYFKKLKTGRKGNTEGMGKCERIQTKTTEILERKAPVRVRAEEAKYDELGMVNFYGYVSKRRAGLNSFHARWMVLRGLELYWYRNVDDVQQKGISILPAKPIQTDYIVGSTKCFVVEKEEGEKDSRKLVFQDADT